MISVILLEKISKLGNIGQEVKVKDGFARNYLIPNKKAIRASEENKKFFEQKREELVKINDEKIKVATEKLKKVPNTINIIREASEQGALFGSVTARDIAKEIKIDDFEVSAKDVILKSVIKNVGESLVKISLHPEVFKEISIIVEKSEESLNN
jgi:large subunit ribosomal protein L9